MMFWWKLSSWSTLSLHSLQSLAGLWDFSLDSLSYGYGMRCRYLLISFLKTNGCCNKEKWLSKFWLQKILVQKNLSLKNLGKKKLAKNWLDREFSKKWRFFDKILIFAKHFTCITHQKPKKKKKVGKKLAKKKPLTNKKNWQIPKKKKSWQKIGYRKFSQ